MKKGFVFLTLLSLSLSLIQAQKNIVYLRFTPADGNSAIVTRQLEKLWDMGNCVIYMSDGEKPIVATTPDDFREIKMTLMSMQADAPYLGQTELEYFDSCFVSLFNEYVTSKLTIAGSYDSDSKCIFLLSENMYNRFDATEYLMEMIAVNNLDLRMDVVIYTYNDSAITKKNGLNDNGKIKYLK